MPGPNYYNTVQLNVTYISQVCRSNEPLVRILSCRVDGSVRDSKGCDERRLNLRLEASGTLCPAAKIFINEQYPSATRWEHLCALYPAVYR